MNFVTSVLRIKERNESEDRNDCRAVKDHRRSSRLSLPKTLSLSCHAEPDSNCLPKCLTRCQKAILSQLEKERKSRITGKYTRRGTDAHFPSDLPYVSSKLTFFSLQVNLFNDPR